MPDPLLKWPKAAVITGVIEMDELSREYHVLRLFAEDKELIQSLGKEDGCTRYEALMRLVPIVEELDLPKYETPERFPCASASPPN